MNKKKLPSATKPSSNAYCSFVKLTQRKNTNYMFSIQHSFNIKSSCKFNYMFIFFSIELVRIRYSTGCVSSTDSCCLFSLWSIKWYHLRFTKVVFFLSMLTSKNQNNARFVINQLNTICEHGSSSNLNIVYLSS